MVSWRNVPFDYKPALAIATGIVRRARRRAGAASQLAGKPSSAVTFGGIVLAPSAGTRGAQELTLSLANHSRLGSLGGELVDGGGDVEMVLGDALTLNYAPSATALPGATGWYLSVRATGGPESSATPARRALATRVPARFALHQNQPNPFRRTTTIAFDLPIASPVTLEVFDLPGRKVATLAQGEHPPGAHTVEYDLREAGGASLRAGVYVYRLRAGTFVEQRKLTVLL